MPDETQLAIVTTKIANPTAERDTWESGEEFVAMLPDGTIKRPNNSVEHPDGPFYAPNLRRIEHMKQYTPEGYVIKPGETRRLWWVSTIPRELSLPSLQIGFNTAGGTDEYDVRWVSTRSCE
jgi:sugar lactone lactonase YvrE